MVNHNYKKSMRYEIFIRSARVCLSHEYGADLGNMQSLLDKDEDASHTRFLKHSLLLATAKKHVIAAIKHAIKRKIDQVDKERLSSFIPVVEQATSGDEILEVCSAGFELVKKYDPR